MESEGRTKQGRPDSSPRPQPESMQKKNSFRSLFSFFKGSASKRARAQADHDAQVSPAQSASIGSSFSTTSLPNAARRPSTVETCASEPVPGREPSGLDSDSSLPSQIRPPFTQRPTSSSSSSSSYENGSETSTTTTTPTNSSASSLRSGPGPEPSRSNPSLKKSKRVSECYRTSPSPLSTVTDARNYPYILPHSLAHQPHPPPTERANHEKPNRRNSISRLMSMRARSTPDLTADIPPVPPLPRTTSKSRRKSFAPTPATAQDVLDHRAILGADPAAGSGFYRYPMMGKEPAPARRSTGLGPRRPPAGGDQWKRNSWGGHYDGDAAMDPRNMGGNGRGSQRRDARGRGTQSFRRNVATQVILEESHDAAEAAAPNRRRHSEIAPPDGWDGSALQAEPVPPIPASYLQCSSSSSDEPSTEASTASTSASSVSTASTVSEDGKLQQSLYSNWDHVSSQLEKHSNQIPAMNDDATKLANCPIPSNPIAAPTVKAACANA